MIILDFLLLALLFYFMVKSYLWVGGNEIGFKGTRGMLVKKSLSIVVSPGIMFNEGIKI